MGAFLLAQLGLLDGRPATTHWGLAEDFRAQLLEQTTREIQEIAWEVGYEDSNSLRRVFLARIGASPREYRRRLAVVR